MMRHPLLTSAVAATALLAVSDVWIPRIEAG